MGGRDGSAPMRRLVWAGFLAATVTMTATCGESKVLDIVRGVPGELTLSLVTPNGGAGGAHPPLPQGPGPVTGARAPPPPRPRPLPGPPGAPSATVADPGPRAKRAVVGVGR